MGYDGSYASWYYGYLWGDLQENFPIVLDDVECTDENSGFASCTSETIHNCGHDEDVFLTCAEPGIYAI